MLLSLVTLCLRLSQTRPQSFLRLIQAVMFAGIMLIHCMSVHFGIFLFYFGEACAHEAVNINMLVILILMITNFKYFLLELFINKRKPYNLSKLCS